MKILKNRENHNARETDTTTIHKCIFDIFLMQHRQHNKMSIFFM